MEGHVTKSSVLYGDKKNDLFFNKIISRASSMGCSSRGNYYYRSHEGVPFEWEMEPGTPKDPPRAAAPLPPLSPPPAVLSLSLPKPCMEDRDQPRKEFPSSLMRLDAWKKLIKKYRLPKFKKEVKRVYGDEDQHKVNKTSRASDVDKFEDSFDFWSSDPRDDFMVSPARSSNSSSGSSLSFPNGPAMESNSVSSLHDQPRSCIPFKLNTILVYVAKRS
ncbi:uncharacterized protein LOC116189123 [Punica granatum]|uniref:Uncharacterized protein n=2 Tax=Punica granatum TaxID=22663 RepID=A0A218XP61_PUNGR|nr:uncharacterized protein LOC116189123 [Punica granatum]OWM87015.1 hypothetical protein CDL15_Pgr016052 [Punica granatum]PKI35456.1 hypothetical protein CRG98_044142 [Punica granatum]